MKLRNILFASMLAAGALSVPSLGQAASFDIEVGVAPPPERVEVVPPPREGYVYEPGHWRYEGNTYVWRNGEYIRYREGHRWVPRRWEHEGEHWRFRAGHWDDQD